MAMIAFGKRLTQLRQENDMKQSELAAKLGISRSAIGMYEQGRRDPDFKLLDDIAELFDVDMNYLLGHSDIRGHYPRHDYTDGKGLVIETATPKPNPTRLEEVLLAYLNARPEIQAAVQRVLGIDK